MSSSRRTRIGHNRVVLWTLILGLGAVASTQAQLAPRPGVHQQSYADYYRRSLQESRRPMSGPQNYIIDKYYYQNPNISPYLNLARWSGGPSINNYYRYVLPEVERRAAAPQRPGTGAFSSPTQSYPITGPVHTPVQQTVPGSFHGNVPYFNNYYNNFGGLKR